MSSAVVMIFEKDNESFDIEVPLDITANELLYGIIEAAIFRIAVLGQSSIDEVYGAIDLAINKLKAN